MSYSLKRIRKPIEEELKVFESYFRESMKTSSNIPLLDRIMYYIVKRKGKQVRPIVVFLSASVIKGTNDATFIAASLVELLHTATLVHDDVVDDANYRRGFFSIKALWKNKIAVLVGDYLLSQGLLLAIKNKEFKILEIGFSIDGMGKELEYMRNPVKWDHILKNIHKLEAFAKENF